MMINKYIQKDFLNNDIRDGYSHTIGFINDITIYNEGMLIGILRS